MNVKPFMTVGMILGSVAGSYLPLLWGASLFSLSSILLGAVSGIFGIWAGYKLARSL